MTETVPNGHRLGKDFIETLVSYGDDTATEVLGEAQDMIVASVLKTGHRGVLKIIIGYEDHPEKGIVVDIHHQIKMPTRGMPKTVMDIDMATRRMSKQLTADEVADAMELDSAEAKGPPEDVEVVLEAADAEKTPF